MTWDDSLFTISLPSPVEKLVYLQSFPVTQWIPCSWVFRAEEERAKPPPIKRLPPKCKSGKRKALKACGVRKAARCAVKGAFSDGGAGKDAIHGH